MDAAWAAVGEDPLGDVLSPPAGTEPSQRPVKADSSPQRTEERLQVPG